MQSFLLSSHSVEMTTIPTERPTLLSRDPLTPWTVSAYDFGGTVITRGQRLKYDGVAVVRKFCPTVDSSNIDEDLGSMVNSAVVKRICQVMKCLANTRHLEADLCLETQVVVMAVFEQTGKFAQC